MIFVLTMQRLTLIIVQCETKNVQFVSRPKTLLTPKCDGVKESNCFQVGTATYVSCCAPLRDLELVLNPGPSCPFTYSPTKLPTTEPTTKEPTLTPTKRPTAEPTHKPTKLLTEEPTAKPTKEPTMDSTKKPTAEPTEKPTKAPTEAPTKDPYCVPAIVGLSQAECKKKIKRCGAASPMRWVGTSCSGGYYAGCQCQQYCAFNCKAKCTSSINKKFCKWEKGECKNKATGEVGVPITQC